MAVVTSRAWWKPFRTTNSAPSRLGPHPAQLCRPGDRHLTGICPLYGEVAWITPDPEHTPAG